MLLKEPISQNVLALHKSEKTKENINEVPDVKITYYQVSELYAEYLSELESLVGYLGQN
jgi:hypothetical protein